MTFHPRTEWQSPAQPIIGPVIRWSTIDEVVIHYTAARNLPDGDPGETQAQIPVWLRNGQRDYTVNRGYSLGYNEMHDWLGDVWEIRGVSIKAAATVTHNEHTYAILIYVDWQDPMTPAQFESVARSIIDKEKLAGRTLRIKGHRDYAPTGCPGDGAYAQLPALRARVAELRNPTRPEPVEPEQPPTEDDMTTAYIWRHPAYKNAWLCGVGSADHLTASTRDYLVTKKQVPEIVEAHDAKLRQCLFQCGLDLTALVPA